MFLSPVIKSLLSALGQVSSAVALIVRLSVFVALLAACGGGGGGGDSSETSVASDTGSENDSDSEVDPDPDPEDPAPEVEGVSLSGTILVSNNSSFDIDTPSASPGSGVLSFNNTINTAQEVLNPVTLGGYLSGKTGRYPNGNEYPIDLKDIFGVSISAGQRINLQVRYASEEDRVNEAEIGLTLSVASKIDPTFRLFSTRIESAITYEIDVDQENNYFITIEAEADSSPVNYILSIGQQVGLSIIGSDDFETSATSSSNFVENEVIVRFKETESSSPNSKPGSTEFLSFSSKASSGSTLESLLNSMSHQEALGQGAHVFRLAEADQELESIALNGVSAKASSGKTGKELTLEMVEMLKQEPSVEFAEPNYIYSSMVISSEDDVRDDLYSQQWTASMIQAPAAWRVSTGENVTVAVIDTGINFDHPDLDDNINLVDGYDFVSTGENEADDEVGRDFDPQDEGTDFHGTHVAGIIAAEGNLIGIRGIAYGAEIMPVRALGRDGTGTSSDIANAILYAAGLENISGQLPTRRADIINLSLGSPDASTLISQAVQAAEEAGVFVVAAAGNEAEFEDTRVTPPSYPAAFESVIAVGAVNEARERSSFSNIGEYIDVVAPGGASSASRLRDNSLDGVLSTIFGSQYAEYVGTSMAAPHVSGVIALLKSVEPSYNPANFRDRLEDMTDDIGGGAATEAIDRLFFGNGLINASKALEVLGLEVPTTMTASPSNLRLSTILEKSNFVLGKTGDGSVQVDSVTSSKDWVIIEAPQDPAGLGAYEISVSEERSNDAELESARINIAYSIDGAPQPNINVDLQVLRTAPNVNNLGDSFSVRLYPFNEDETSENMISVQPTFVRNRYTFSFENVPPGTYKLAAGTDFDGDGRFEEAGESFGSYFSVFDAQPVVITEDSDEVRDFNVQF